MSNRAERRRQARAQSKHTRTPVLIAGENIVAASLGVKYEGRPAANLPDKQPGVHRWIAAGVWVLRELDAERAFDADHMKMLDNENLMELGIMCWDCENPLGSGANGTITVGSTCTATGDEP